MHMHFAKLKNLELFQTCGEIDVTSFQISDLLILPQFKNININYTKLKEKTYSRKVSSKRNLKGLITKSSLLNLRLYCDMQEGGGGRNQIEI